MKPYKKKINKFVKLIIKNDFQKADLRTLKIYKFTNDFIYFDVMINKQNFYYKYTNCIAEKFYNIFLEFENKI